MQFLSERRVCFQFLNCWLHGLISYSWETDSCITDSATTQMWVNVLLTRHALRVLQSWFHQLQRLIEFVVTVMVLCFTRLVSISLLWLLITANTPDSKCHLSNILLHTSFLFIPEYGGLRNRHLVVYCIYMFVHVWLNNENLPFGTKKLGFFCML